MEQTTAKENFFIKSYHTVKDSYGVLVQHRYTTLAGTLVYFLITSLTPFLFWVTLLFGRAHIDYTALGLFDWAGEFLSVVQANAQQATVGVSVFFLATTLFSSTGFFYHLRRIGEIVYGYRSKKHGWKVRIAAVLLTFVIILFFVLACATILAVNLLCEGLPGYIIYPIRYILALIFAFLLAWALNGFVCPYKVSPADTALGAFFTALAWVVASIAFTIYLNFARPERLYGAFSLVVVFLLWLYWLMICLISGVIFNRYRLRRRVHKRL